MIGVRRCAALVLGVALALGITASGASATQASVATAPVASKKDCGDAPLPIKIACETKNAAESAVKDPKKALGSAVGSLKDAASAFDKARQAFEKFTPAGFMGEIAKNAGQWAVSMVNKIQEYSLKASKPRVNEQGWLGRYAVMSGVGFIIFAFTMLLVTARVASSGGRDVSSMMLLRQAGVSLWTVPVGIVMGPAVIITLSGLFGDLTKSFIKLNQESAATKNIEALVDQLATSADNSFTGLGGPLGAVAGFVIMAVLGLLVLIELFVASIGVELLALFIPIALGLYVYPPWRGAFHRIACAILGFMLLPVVMNIVFWIVWGSMGDAIAKAPSWEALLRILVGLVLIVSTPALTTWLLPKVLPDGSSSAAPRVSRPTNGMVTSMMVGRLLSKQENAGGRRTAPIQPAPAGATPGARSGGKAGGLAPVKAGAGSRSGAATKKAAGAGATKAGAGAAGAKAGAGAAGGPAGVAAAAVLMGAKSAKDGAKSKRDQMMQQGDHFGQGGGSR